mgnify:CR=1 FL=1
MKKMITRRNFLKAAGVSAAALGLAACGGSSSSTASSAAGSTAASSTAAKADGKVYYLNFKPEQDQAWQDLAKVYTEETGVPVTVVTAASGQYETTLMSEMEKSEAPTLFQVNGPTVLRTGRITAPICPIPSSAVSSLTTPWLCSPMARIWVSTGSRRATVSSTTSSCSRRLATRPRTSTPSTS